MFRFLLISLFLGQAFADSPKWVVVEKAPYLSVAEWGRRLGFKVFYDFHSGRIFLERKESAPIIFLMDQPYALRGETFVYLPKAPLRKDGTIFLAKESVERVVYPVVGKAAELKALPVGEEPIKTEKIEPIAKTQIKTKCSLDHPVKKIFLDPGHGGEDAGTKSGSVAEKDIVLSFSKLLGKELEEEGFEVLYSRTRNVYLPLEIRSKLALESKADLFLSLHVNNSPHPSIHGTETYILNQEATDAEARKLALLENSIVQSAKEKQSAVQDILWDMEQTAYLQDSAYLAAYVQESIVKGAGTMIKNNHWTGDWKNRGVRQAPFYVLNRAAMPAVLVELAYLSNSRDRKLLTEELFLKSLAKAMAGGVKKYRDACPKFR